MPTERQPTPKRRQPIMNPRPVRCDHRLGARRVTW